MFLIGLRKVLSTILSFILGFFTYPISFIPSMNDKDIELSLGAFSSESVFLNGESEKIYFDE